jgi:hypothetical protein
MEGPEFTESTDKEIISTGLVQRYKKVASVAKKESIRAPTAIP